MVHSVVSGGLVQLNRQRLKALQVVPRPPWFDWNISMKSQVDVWCWISPRFPRLLLEGPLLVYSHVILKAELQIWANCMAKINMTRMTRLVESFSVLNCKRCFVHFSFIQHALWFSETYMYEYNSLHTSSRDMAVYVWGNASCVWWKPSNSIYESALLRSSI